MKKILAYVLLIFISISLKANTKDSLVLKLEQAIENRDYYVDLKLKRISKIKLSINTKESEEIQYKKYSALYNEYKSFNFDSAFTYAKKLNQLAYKMANNEKIALTKTDISFILLSAGMFKETLDTLQTIQMMHLSDSAKYNYFYIAARTYFDMADYASEDHFFKIYNIKGNEYINKGLHYCSNGESRYYLLLGLQSLRNANWDLAKESYEKLINIAELPQSEYAVAAASLAYIYSKSNEPEKSYLLLADAAKTDILQGIKETSALRSLSELEFQTGNVKRAYKFIKFALDDAFFYGARYRRVQISYILPIIEEKHLQEVESRKKLLLIYLFCISALVILLALFVLIILKLNRKLRATKSDLAKSNEKLSNINAQLTEANQIKEEYIGQFFNIISEYIEKIEKFKKAISRKLTTHNISEIKDTVDTINPKKEREELYLSFDKIFLKVFPSFIGKFNLLLKTEEQFVIKDNQPLVPELRIIALMRLGIDDPEKIAKILNYSIHTIYSYKAKIKNKALIPNELFESKDMDIRFRSMAKRLS